MKSSSIVKSLALIFLVSSAGCLKKAADQTATLSGTSEKTWQTIQAAGPGPIRSIIRRTDGLLLGPVSTGHGIVIMSSRDEGVSWSRHGSVVKNDRVDFGDPTLLAIPGTSTIFCAFREHLDGRWLVTVTRSDNNGDDWVYDSTVVGPVVPFVGAPFLHLASNGDLQVYYDSELLAEEKGAHRHQWIAMQGRRGISGPWDAYGVVTASKIEQEGALSREGMATVVSLGGSRLMLVTEGVEPFPTGNASANVIHAIESFDDGRTWDHSTRRTVYSARVDPVTGKRFNAYVPYAKRVGKGPVGVAFCTDEDFVGPPDPASASVGDRRCHVKYVQTTKDFESWSAASPVWTGASRNYTPGLFERVPNDLIVTIDQLGGGIRIMSR